MDKILIVDDEKLVGDVLAEAMGSLPFDVVVTQDPVEGLELFHRINPFLVILDINMQPINGLEFINLLIQNEVPAHGYSVPASILPRNQSESPHTLRDADFYVLVLTGAGSKELMKKCRTLGVEYFLNKPVHLNVLKNAINTIHLLKTKRDELNNTLRMSYTESE